MANLSNSEIKRLKSLQQKKFRDELGLFTVEGEKMVAEALQSRFEVESIYRKDEIGAETMSRISSLSSPSPVLALLRKPKDTYLRSEEAAELVNNCGRGLYLALDTMRDPGNLGTVLRIADWFGIDMVFAGKGSVEVFNPKVVQATMGAIFRVKFHYIDNLPDFCKRITGHGGKVYGTFLDGRNIYARELSTGADSPAVIVIGNESEGISPEVAAQVSDRLYIPPFPADSCGSESLNAAVATAITVAEFRRRSL